VFLLQGALVWLISAPVQLAPTARLDDPGVERLGAFPEPFRGELTSLWNTWLTRAYPTDEAIRAQWEELRSAGTLSATAQPVVVIVRQKRRRRNGGLLPML